MLDPHEDRMQRELQIMQQYRVYYEARNPLPVRHLYAEDNRLIYVALTALVIASVIVSAYHTIPIFVGQELTIITFIVGIAVFTMIELGIVSLTYINIKKTYQKDAAKHADVLRWLRIGLGLVVTVGIGANVYSTTREAGFTSPLVDLGIRIIVGLSAPAIAFVCGEVLAMTTVDGQAKQKELDREFDVKMVEYQDEFLKAWDARKSKWLGSISVSKEPDNRPQLSVGVSANGQGYTRRTDARTTVQAHLEAHPQDMSLSVRELADKLHVGKTTVADVLKEKRQS